MGGGPRYTLPSDWLLASCWLPVGCPPARPVPRSARWYFLSLNNLPVPELPLLPVSAATPCSQNRSHRSTLMKPWLHVKTFFLSLLSLSLSIQFKEVYPSLRSFIPTIRCCRFPGGHTRVRGHTSSGRRLVLGITTGAGCHHHIRRSGGSAHEHSHSFSTPPLLLLPFSSLTLAHLVTTALYCIVSLFGACVCVCVCVSHGQGLIEA